MSLATPYCIPFIETDFQVYNDKGQLLLEPIIRKRPNAQNSNYLVDPLLSTASDNTQPPGMAKKSKSKVRSTFSSEDNNSTSTKCLIGRPRLRSVDEDEDHEPMGVRTGLNSKRSSAARKTVDGESSSTREKVPTLYKEDLGTAGIKKNSASSISAVDKSGQFLVPLTEEEERRRKERQMRFSSSDQAPKSTLDGLLSALSASRKRTIKNEDSSRKKKKRKKEPFTDDDSDDVSSQNGFVGTCQNLEKPYLRLTTFPKAEDVRPLSVLQKSLAHIKNRYVESEDFDWANEQLKSVRQDLTVQGLKNDFVLEVYETHARILLEQGVLDEFNQCQTMIKSLTLGMSIDSKSGSNTCSDNGTDSITSTNLDNSDGSTSLLRQADDAADEFGAYRLLYALFQRRWDDVTKELQFASAVLEKEVESNHAHRMSGCRHAVLVTKAVVHNDYHAFFRLYDSAPNLSAYLMDFLVQRVRKSAYERIVTAYRPTLSVEFFREALYFRDLEETRQFLKQMGAVFVLENGAPPFWVDCKASR